jgi:hypothetical protein
MEFAPHKYASRAENMRGSLHNQKRGAVRVGVNVTTDQLERVRRLALAKGFSVAGAIRLLIEAGLEHHPVTPGCHDPHDQSQIG